MFLSIIKELVIRTLQNFKRKNYGDTPIRISFMVKYVERYLSIWR